ncbi:hypothetical protein [Amycolatopsis sp. lyj-109]|uniref:hypothetical protein n=1 Tax=Amycolatopsis sp. lyj-109 TaxID=2789287 RepID=UPI00397BE366
MSRTLSRVAGIVFAGALATFAATPAALAQTETSTSPTDTTTSTSETPTSGSPTSTTAPSSTSVTPPTTPPTTPSSARGDVKTTEKQVAPKAEAEPDKPVQEAPKDDYQDNVGHGFVGLGGEGVLVIACAAGKPSGVATQYLSVTGGPDQDEADGRLWNYSVRVVDAPAGTTTAKFSWTCDGAEGNGVVEFEQEQQPPTSTVTATSTSAPASSTAPITTAPITTATSSTPAGNAAPKAQVKVAPKGGVETGFGGTAR